MSETKNKGGRPKKDDSRLLSKTLQVKVTKSESDLLDRYCQANGIERADYLRKRILVPLHAWAKQQAQQSPAIIPDKAPETTTVPKNNEMADSVPRERKKLEKPNFLTINTSRAESNAH